jgi:hypothetical protein
VLDGLTRLTRKYFSLGLRIGLGGCLEIVMMIFTFFASSAMDEAPQAAAAEATDEAKETNRLLHQILRQQAEQGTAIKQLEAKATGFARLSASGFHSGVIVQNNPAHSYPRDITYGGTSTSIPPAALQILEKLKLS